MAEESSRGSYAIKYVCMYVMIKSRKISIHRFIYRFMYVCMYV